GCTCSWPTLRNSSRWASRHGLWRSPTPPSAWSRSSPSRGARPEAPAAGPRGRRALSGSRSTPTKILPKRARLAAGRRAAIRLSDGNEQGVKLVEERGIGRQVRLQPGAGFLVRRVRGNRAVAGQDAPGVRVRDEDGPADGVKQDRVGRFGTEPGDRQQARAQHRKVRLAHPVELPAVPIEQPASQRQKTPGLQPVGAGRPDHARELLLWQGGDALERQESPGAEGGDG